MATKKQMSCNSVKLYRHAGYKLKRLYPDEYKTYFTELKSYTKAQAKLNREHHSEFREILNVLAPNFGHRTAEVRRLQKIARLENQLQNLLKENINV